MLSGLLVLASVIFLDVILSGDNAVIIGMAANTLPEAQRNGAITFGMAAAAGARIILCLFAISLLQYRLVSIIGGIALLVVIAKLVKELLYPDPAKDKKSKTKQGKTFWTTIGIIALADVSMSLDNILAVAGLARNNPFIMTIGLICSIAFVALGAKIVSTVLEKHKWLNWVGIALIGIVAFELVFGIKAV